MLLESKLLLALRETLLNLWNQISGDYGLWLKTIELQIKNELEVCYLSKPELWTQLAFEFAFHFIILSAL